MRIPSQGSREDEDNGDPYLPPVVSLSYQALDGRMVTPGQVALPRKRGGGVHWNDFDGPEGQRGFHHVAWMVGSTRCMGEQRVGDGVCLLK